MLDELLGAHVAAHRSVVLFPGAAHRKGERKRICSAGQSSDGGVIGTANPVFTRSMMTIVLKALMSEFS